MKKILLSILVAIMLLLGGRFTSMAGGGGTIYDFEALGNSGTTFTSNGIDFLLTVNMIGVNRLSCAANYIAVDNFVFTNIVETAPIVTTQAASSIASTTATGNGNITSLGSPNPTAYGICWNTSGTPTIANSKVDKGAASATGAFTASMTGLTASTTYHVRAFATNTAGTSYGTEVSFTTGSALVDLRQ